MGRECALGNVLREYRQSLILIAYKNEDNEETYLLISVGIVARSKSIREAHRGYVKKPCEV